MLRITEAVLHEMIAHARRDLPDEACGYLGEKNGLVSRIHPMTNADASPEHFSLLPAEQFAVLRTFRAEGFRLAGVYHSHPETPARMSDEDIRLLVDPALSYVIVSLEKPEAAVKAFTVGGGVKEQDMVVVGEN